MHIFNVTFDSIFFFLKQQRFIAQCSSYQEVHDFISSRSILQWGHFSWCVDRILSLSQLLFFLCVRTLIWFMRALPSWPNYPPKVPRPNVIPLGARMPTYGFWEDANIQPLTASLASSMCGADSLPCYHSLWLFWYAILRKIDALHFNTIEFSLFVVVYYFRVLLTKSIPILMLKIISYFLQKSWNIVTLLRIFIINECWISLKAFAASTKIII